MVDRGAGMMRGAARGNKRADKHAVETVNGFIRSMCHQKVEFRTKVRDLRTARNQQTNCTNGHLKDSQSMGAVESSITWWRVKLETWR